MRRFASAALLTIASLALSGCGQTGGGSASREQVRAVGSSTVFPFAKIIAEMLARSDASVSSPIIESTGTGSGINLFCAGLGANTPDIVNASRRMDAEEFATCVRNGVDQITEIQVGLDGIALASAKDGIRMNLSPELIYRALAANPYGKPQTANRWSDLDPSLPNERILVYGPPSTSGTRDALKELILIPGCETDPQTASLKETDEEAFERVCTELRSDGAYVDQGEQDNLIVQKIEANPQAVGVFGYSYLEENLAQLQGLPINGVMPEYDSIASFEYPGARPLYLYVKKAHLDAIPGLRAYLAAWTDNWGPDGPLTDKGMVASPSDTMAANAKAATTFPNLTAAQLN